MNCSVAAAPGPSVPSVSPPVDVSVPTVSPVAGQAPAGPLQVTTLAAGHESPDPGVSRTTAPVTGTVGLLFVTTRVYVVVDPATTCEALLVLVMDRSAPPVPLVIVQVMSSPARAAVSGHCRLPPASVPAPEGRTVADPAEALVQAIVELYAVGAPPATSASSNCSSARRCGSPPHQSPWRPGPGCKDRSRRKTRSQAHPRPTWSRSRQ